MSFRLLHKISNLASIHLNKLRTNVILSETPESYEAATGVV